VTYGLTRQEQQTNRREATTMSRRRLAPPAPVTGLVTAVVTALLLAGCGGQGGHGRAAGSTQKDGGRHTASARPPRDSSGWDRHPDTIAAVGDSITRAFNACNALADCPSASWSTGDGPQVDSLARRLPDRRHEGDDTWNLAQDGAVMAQLPEQMRRAARHRPQLVTVLIGANDACKPTADAMTPVDDFRTGFAEALRTLRAQAPHAEVYVASVPDLERLWEVGRGHEDAREVWGLGICQSMLARPRDTGPDATERRNRVRERVKEYNRALRQVCADDRRCRYDDGAVFGYRLTAADLSDWDWFHPSKRGQDALAELAYRHITGKDG
jgi:lysophospholipase L1-like esterase